MCNFVQHTPVHVLGFQYSSHRDDILRPSCVPMSKFDDEVLSDNSLIDSSPLYKKEHAPQAKVSVSDLKAELRSEVDCDHFCLDTSQRDAICNILSQPLTLIKVP